MGRPPKDPSKLSRARDRRRQRPWVVLEGGPVPPPPLRGARRLHPMTRRWWKTWCSSPQAAEFIGTDWMALEMLACIVEAYNRTDDPKLRRQLVREIRLSEARFEPRRRPPADHDDDGDVAA